MIELPSAAVEREDQFVDDYQMGMSHQVRVIGGDVVWG